MSENKQTVRRKVVKLLIVIAGIVLGQAILYSPSLIGEKVLLPLDILTLKDFYIPPTPETVKIVPHNKILSDPVTEFEPARRFAISEIHQGRFPLWAGHVGLHCAEKPVMFPPRQKWARKCSFSSGCGYA